MEYLASSIWIKSLFISFIISVLTIKLSLIIINKTKTIDTPNKRSNHSIPTPKGAGIGLALSFLIIYYMFFSINDFIFTTSVALLSLISFINDNKHVPIIYRLTIQMILALLVLLLWEPLINLPLLSNIIPKWIGLTIVILFIIWMTNLYNFMDGSDGYAAAQALFAIFYASLLSFSNSSYSLYTLLLVGFFISVLGFFVRNFPPAKIFMGDVGSITIGSFFGFLIIFTASNSVLSIYTWLILLSLFITDASYTPVSYTHLTLPTICSV